MLLGEWVACAFVNWDDDLVLFSRICLYFSSFLFLLIKLFRFFFSLLLIFFSTCVLFFFLLLFVVFIFIPFYCISFFFSLLFWFLIWLCVFPLYPPFFTPKIGYTRIQSLAEVKVVDLPDVWATWLDSGHIFFIIQLPTKKKSSRR